MFLFSSILYQITVNIYSYNSCNGIDEKASKTDKFCILQNIFFSLKFFEISFLSSLFDLACASIISSHVITESSI